MPDPIYSKRNKPTPTTLTEVLDAIVRNRIIATLVHIMGGERHLQESIKDVGDRCRREYGFLRGKDSQFGGSNGNEHWMYCRNDEAIDFLEMLFESKTYKAGQSGVDAINKIFREQGVGFSFTDYVVQEIPLDKYYPNASPALIELLKINGPTQPLVTYPKAIKLTSLYQHEHVIMPALRFLADRRFENADREMLNAHAQYRAADYGAAMNACGQAFESTFKAILTVKGWQYDKDKHTLSNLIEIGRANNLFPPFYVEIFKNAGTLRNKFGSHGGAEYGLPDAHHAEHLIGLVSAHILVLAKFAKL